MWVWQNEDGTTENFYDAEMFRRALEERHVAAELRPLLPRPIGKPVELPAEAALRERMCGPAALSVLRRCKRM